jgi:phage terminase small subunit
MFVLEYRVDANATQAAIRAGYSQRTASEQGCRLLTNVKVAAALAEAQAARAAALDVTIERLDREAGCLATSDIRRMIHDEKFVRLEDIPDELAPAIASIEVVLKRVGNTDEYEKLAKVRLWDKNAALRTLYQRRGALTENMNVKGALALDVTARTARIREEIRRMSTEDLRANDHDGRNAHRRS